MSALPLMRRLAEQRQFESLQQACGAPFPQCPGEQALLALACVHLGDVETARRWIGALDPVGRLDVDTRVDLAAAHLLLGQLDAAQALLNGARAEAPEHALLLARLAACHLQRQEMEAARELYERSLALQPRILTYLHLLRLYLQGGQVARAVETLSQAEDFWFGEQPHWPTTAYATYTQQLRGMRLELWLAQARQAEAEAWLAEQRSVLGEGDWCALMQGFAQLLSGTGAYAQAEELLREALRHYPQRLGLYSLLAEFAQQQGHAPRGAALLRKAIRMGEQQGSEVLPLWLRLASSHLPHNPKGARHAVEQAMGLLGSLQESSAQLSEWRAQTELALADIETHEQRHAQAEQRYQALLDSGQCLLSALLGLGNLHLQLGRIDAAVVLFRRAAEIDPARGHAALINARHFPDDAAALEQLERMARPHGAQGKGFSNLLFPLAAAWEKRKDYVKSFALVEEANAASRRLLSYDPRAHRQRCARIRHAFSASLYDQGRGRGSPSILPVFVLGMPRSGTTLIEQILAGHSQIHGAGELGVVPTVIAGLERWERHVGSGRHYPDCVDDLCAQVIEGITERILKELQDYAPEALHVVDKLPHNFENIGLIKLLFPKARIISVRRDPRDIAISNYFTDYAAKHGGMGFAYDLDWIGEQLADHNLLMHHWNQIFPGEILEVRYEDVLADAEGQARRMLDYIGVGWEPQVLNFSELERPVKTASVWQVRQPIYTSSREKWRRYEPWLAPLIAATNRPIRWEPITMLSLPEPGLLGEGVARYRAGELDAAEHRFKQLLHHLPEHAAANFMVGLIYVHKGHLADGIALMEQGLTRCPWNKNWRSDLLRACDMAGDAARAARWRQPVPEEEA